MTEDKQTPEYQVAPGHTFAIPQKERISQGTASKYLSEGDPIPPHWFSEAQLQELVSQGKIRPINYTAMSPEQADRVRTSSPGKWRVSPAAVAGKELSELHAMIVEIDPEFDISSITDIGQAAALLTSDWNPAFHQPAPPVTDKSKPISMHDQTQENGKPTTQLVGNSDKDTAVQDRIAELAARASQKSAAEVAEAEANAGKEDLNAVTAQGDVQDSNLNVAQQQLADIKKRLEDEAPEGAH